MSGTATPDAWLEYDSGSGDDEDEGPIVVAWTAVVIPLPVPLPVGPAEERGAYWDSVLLRRAFRGWFVAVRRCPFPLATPRPHSPPPPPRRERFRLRNRRL